MFGQKKKMLMRRMDEELFEHVAMELSQNLIHRGLWAKAFALSDGDDNRTRAKYIELRVRSIKDEIVITGVGPDDAHVTEPDQKSQEQYYSQPTEEELLEARIKWEASLSYEQRTLITLQRIAKQKGYKISVAGDSGFILETKFGEDSSLYQTIDELSEALRKK